MTAQTNAKLTGNRSKCPVCGEVFSTLRNFESHRYGDYTEGRKCLDPQDAGLRIVHTSTGSLWKMESTYDWSNK